MKLVLPLFGLILVAGGALALAMERPSGDAPPTAQPVVPVSSASVAALASSGQAAPSAPAARVSIPPGNGPLSPAQAASLLAPLFDTFDCDELGYFRLKEITHHFGQVFDSRDRDTSGALSRPEFLESAEGGTAEHHDQHFDRIDTDRDDSISADEYRAHLHKLFDLLDADQDRELTRAELDASFENSAGDKLPH